MAKSRQPAETNPYSVLDSLRGKASRRKLRLFACGCCRERLWPLLTDKRSRQAVEEAERYADGAADWPALRAARAAAVAACEAVRNRPLARRGVHFSSTVAANAAQAAAMTAHRQSGARGVAGLVFSTVYYGVGLNDEGRRDAERAAHLELVRCVFGDTLRPVAFDPAWRTPGAVALARTAYEERRFQDLPLLADALEEAGCSDEAILEHCRGPSPHVRGCWAVDLVLGKE
jgi:hypothetical protein